MTRWPRSVAILTASIWTILSSANWAAAAEARPCSIAVHVSSVLAANTNQGTDARLIPISHQLQSVFSYTTYRLLSSQQGHTACGSHMVLFTLPGGRLLHIEPQGIESGMISMRLSIFQGKTLMVVTDVKLNNRGVLMVGGPRYGKGVVITSIRADSPELAARPASAALAQPPHAAAPAPASIHQP